MRIFNETTGKFLIEDRDYKVGSLSQQSLNPYEIVINVPGGKKKKIWFGWGVRGSLRISVRGQDRSEYKAQVVIGFDETGKWREA